MWKKKPIRRSDIAFEFDCQETLEPGGGKRRDCDACSETVWDTSKMTRAEYEALPQTDCIMATFEGDTMVFAPEPTPLRSALIGLAAAGILALPIVGSLGCDSFDAPLAIASGPEDPHSSESSAVVAPGAASAPDQDDELALEDVPDYPDDLPVELTAAERRLAYRLKTEYGIDIDGYEDQATTPAYRAPTTIRSAMNDLEIIQQKRDIRNGTASHPIRKKTLREAVEELEVIHRKRERFRVKGKRVRIQLLEGDEDY